MPSHFQGKAQKKKICEKYGIIHTYIIVTLKKRVRVVGFLGWWLFQSNGWLTSVWIWYCTVGQHNMQSCSEKTANHISLYLIIGCTEVAYFFNEFPNFWMCVHCLTVITSIRPFQILNTTTTKQCIRLKFSRSAHKWLIKYMQIQFFVYIVKTSF